MKQTKGEIASFFFWKNYRRTVFIYFIDMCVALFSMLLLKITEKRKSNIYENRC